MRMLLSRFSVLNKAFIFHSIVLYPLVDNYKSMNRLHFISLLALVSGLASAQQLPVYSEYAYRQYTTQDGLPKMYTECVFQDSQGFIWVGVRCTARYVTTDFNLSPLICLKMPA